MFLVFTRIDDDTPLVKEGGSFRISELADHWNATFAFFVGDSDNLRVLIITDVGSA